MKIFSESLAMVNFGGVMVEGGATTSDTVRARGSGQETKYTVLLLSTDNGTPLDPLFSPLTVGDPIVSTICSAGICVRSKNLVRSEFLCAL